MRQETHIVNVGEWLGAVPDDWDFAAFFAKHLASCGYPRERFDRSVLLFKTMAEALRRGDEVWAEQSGGYEHKVIDCGLYDGWVYWLARPCYQFIGPIGVDRDEFYNLQSIRVTERVPA